MTGDRRKMIRDGDPSGLYAIGARAPRNMYGWDSWGVPEKPTPPIIRKRGEFDPTKLETKPQPQPSHPPPPWAFGGRQDTPAAPAPKPALGFRYGATPPPRRPRSSAKPSPSPAAGLPSAAGDLAGDGVLPRRQPFSKVRAPSR